MQLVEWVLQHAVIVLKLRNLSICEPFPSRSRSLTSSALKSISVSHAEEKFCLSLSLLQLTCRADAPLHSISTVSQLQCTYKTASTAVGRTALSQVFLTAETSSVHQECDKKDLNTKLIRSMQSQCTTAGKGAGGTSVLVQKLLLSESFNSITLDSRSKGKWPSS